MGVVAQAWTVAVGRLGGDTGVAAAAGAELERRYAEPHRVYHVGAHVEDVLRGTTRLGSEVGLDGEDVAVVTLAACAHDAVYELAPGEDERASAEWATAQLHAAGIDEGYVARVGALVLATADHRVDPGDLPRSVLNDADLAVLAGAPGDYAAYVDAVRREYRAVPDEQWRTGRAAVLGALLAGPRLYATDLAYERWEDAARRNVRAELDALREA